MYLESWEQQPEYGQFLPVAENTPEHVTLIQEVDKKYGLTTYAQDFLE